MKTLLTRFIFTPPPPPPRLCNHIAVALTLVLMMALPAIASAQTLPKCTAEHLGITFYLNQKTAVEGQTTFGRGFLIRPIENLCDTSNIPRIPFCATVWDTTSCGADSPTCRNGRVVFVLATNTIITNHTLINGNRLCGSLNLDGWAVVVVNPAENAVRDNPRNRLVLILDNGVAGHIDILDND